MHRRLISSPPGRPKGSCECATGAWWSGEGGREGGREVVIEVPVS